jgi:hypothetical protein
MSISLQKALLAAIVFALPALSQYVAPGQTNTNFTDESSSVTVASVGKVNGSLVAPKGADILTVGIIGGECHEPG